MPCFKSAVRKKGFTLIELLVVISIIGILAAFAIASFTSAQARGRDAQRKSDLDALRKALELYKTDQSGGTYPLSPAYTDGSALTSAYIKTVPTEKKTGWTPYAYTSADGSTFTLKACLENSSDPNADSPVVACKDTSGAFYTVTEP